MVTAVLAVTLEFHAAMVPSSVAKIKLATFPIRKSQFAPLPATWPVGVPKPWSSPRRPES